jgi:hypothetical protein
MWYPIWIASALLSFASVTATEMLLPPAEAHDLAKPKIADAKVLEEGTERVFREVNRKIERQHQLIFEGSNEIFCKDEGDFQPVQCEIEWNSETKH